MYGYRGGMSKSQIGYLSRKNGNETLDKQLEKISPSASKRMNGKDRDRISIPSTSAGMQSKNKFSDG